MEGGQEKTIGKRESPRPGQNIERELGTPAAAEGFEGKRKKRKIEERGIVG